MTLALCRTMQWESIVAGTVHNARQLKLIIYTFISLVSTTMETQTREGKQK